MEKVTIVKRSIPQRSIGELRTELLRKSIHLTVGMVPLFAQLNLSLTMTVLMLGTLFYTFAEKNRIEGRALPVIGRLTEMAARKRDVGGVVMGPITLGIGSMLCLLLYPEPAAAIGIYALAFGDGLSSLVGKFLGTVQIPYTGGKTLEGTSAGILAVAIAVYARTQDIYISFTIALFAGFLEILPLKDLDNIVIPVGTGLFAYLLYIV